jgi:hypothetical protein
MRKQHAEHNEQLCLKINQLTGYNDWVITTAFYACIHYVEHKLFPLTVNGVTYATFDSYYHAQSGNASKHKIKLNLVTQYLPTMGSNYRRLKDLCHTARYSNYRMGSALSSIALKDMASIKAACIA